MQNTSVSTFLTLFSGLCWTVVYLDSLRLGLKYRTYAMPFWALALNITWELLHSVLDYQRVGLALQVGINVVWACLDLGILYTYFRFGSKYFPKNIPRRWFVPWSLLGLLTAFVVQVLFITEFGLAGGGVYAAFLQNLLMSVLFIHMLVQRGGSDGQSLLIAVSKWLGTLAPTLLFGLLGGQGFNHPSAFVLVVGLSCSLFDLLYIGMLAQTRQREKESGGKNVTIGA